MFQTTNQITCVRFQVDRLVRTNGVLEEMLQEFGFLKSRLC